jgi:hypothetical protein
VRISRREALSFALARKLLAHYEATPLHMDMRADFDKIAESLEGDISIEPDWLREHVGVLPEDLGKTLPIPYRSGYPPPQMSSRNRSFDRRSASQDCASSAEPPVRLR